MITQTVVTRKGPRALLLALFLILGLALSAWSGQGLDQALRALDQGRPRQALEALEAQRPPRSNKERRLYYLVQGRCHLLLGQPDQALDTLKSGCRDLAKDCALHQGLGRAALETGDLDRARMAFVKAYKLDKSQGPGPLYLAATAAYRDQDFNACLDILKQALVLAKAPPPADWLELLVQAGIETRNWTEANSAAQRLLTNYASQARYWRLAAHLAWRQEELTLAAARLEAATRLTKPSAEQLRSLAGLYAATQALLTAAKTLQRLPADKLGPEDQARIGRWYAQALRVDQALTALGQQSRDTCLRQGQVLYRAGRFAQALKALRQVEGPKRDLARLLAGYSAWQLRDWDQAQRLMDSVSQGSKYSEQAESAARVLARLIASQGP